MCVYIYICIHLQYMSLLEAKSRVLHHPMWNLRATPTRPLRIGRLPSAVKKLTVNRGKVPPNPMENCCFNGRCPQFPAKAVVLQCKTWVYDWTLRPGVFLGFGVSRCAYIYIYIYLYIYIYIYLYIYIKHYIYDSIYIYIYTYFSFSSANEGAQHDQSDREHWEVKKIFVFTQ